MNLARPFKAGEGSTRFPVASRRLKPELDYHPTWAARVETPHQSSLRDENRRHVIPALKRQAKFIPTLRVEDRSKTSGRDILQRIGKILLGVPGALAVHDERAAHREMHRPSSSKRPARRANQLPGEISSADCAALGSNGVARNFLATVSALS